MVLNIIVGKFPDFQGMCECTWIWEGEWLNLPEFMSKDQIAFYRCQMPQRAWEVGSSCVCFLAAVFRQMHFGIFAWS